MGKKMNELQTYDEASTSNLVMNSESMAHLVKTAELMASAKVTIPKHLQGSTGDCLAVVMQAMQFRMNPFAVAQKTHLVNGVLGYEAQLVNAVVCASGAITGGFEYEYQGDGEAVQCRVGAVLRGKSGITWGEWLSAKSVTTRNSPLWKTNPKQQLGYLQVKNWARLYAPGAILGVYSVDELETIQKERDMGQAEVIPPAAPAFYPDEQFAANLPKWSDLIKSGKKTAAQIIAIIQSKAPLSDAQKAALEAVKVVGQKPEPEIEEARFFMTYASVADAIHKSASMDTLDIACDLIGEVDNPEHRAELSAMAQAKKAELA